jgi:hypothetical protein
MKYYFLLTVMLVLGIAVAQSVTVQKPVECADTATLLRGLSGSDYKENPIWLGIEPGSTVSRYSLFVNEQTKTWTLIQFNDTIACVLGTGDASTKIFTGPKI